MNPHVIDTRTSNVPVCRFQHFRKSHLTARKILAHLGYKVKSYFVIISCVGARHHAKSCSTSKRDSVRALADERNGYLAGVDILCDGGTIRGMHEFKKPQQS